MNYWSPLKPVTEAQVREGTDGRLFVVVPDAQSFPLVPLYEQPAVQLTEDGARKQPRVVMTRD